jgi:ribosomal protein S12 methylthiotransferase
VDSVSKKLAICRTMSDAPEIDGNLFIDKKIKYLKQGDIVKVRVTGAGDYDLFGELLNEN